VRLLREQGFEVTGLFDNPNIHPLTEYVRRRDTLREFQDHLGIKVIYKCAEYAPLEWFRRVSHREENRCFHCYRMRLESAAAVATRGGFDAFSTTLLYSRFQKHELIAEVGRDLAAAGGAEFCYADFREGWKEGVTVSKELGMYRQQYCGCLYSENERFGRELRRGTE
jgi:predicted adenine nucleotide alpha hydrolase (AANH) superfamily ATPase